jgi:hypothetical protein
MLSITEAAKLADVNPSTIHRALNSGRLSSVDMKNGRKGVDPAELARVYDISLPPNVEGDATQDAAQDDKSALIAELRATIRRLEVTLDLERARLDSFIRVATVPQITSKKKDKPKADQVDVEDMFKPKKAKRKKNKKGKK